MRLDTHVVAWLFSGATAELSPTAVELIEAADELTITPIVELELTYLHEIERLTVDAATIVSDLRGRIGLRTSDVETAELVKHAHELDWTRDPFDRLVVADAMAAGDRLLTRDRTIRHNCALADW